MAKPTTVMISAPIHPVPPRHGAAVEWWMWQVSRQLRRWQAHIISIGGTDYAPEETVDGIHVHRITIGRVYRRLFQKITRLDPWGYAARAADHIERVGADCVHVHNDVSLFRDLKGRSRDPDRQYLLHLHNERENLVGLDDATLIVVSNYLRDWYRDRLPDADICVLTNGVDIAQFGHGTARRDEPIRWVLYAGRISPEKGPLALAQAMRGVIARLPDVGFMVVGEFATGTQSSRRVQYGNEVRAALAELPPQRVDNLGILPPERMHEAFARADLVVMPSRFNEPLGMVALEAMASGVPVLAVPRGGLPEFVHEGETGYLLPDSDDPADMAERIVEVLSTSPRQRDRIVARAESYVREHHDWPVVARALETIYDDLHPSTP